jgi:Domain of unknown function (DUF1943)/Lipoprotein amino terminal region
LISTINILVCRQQSSIDCKNIEEVMNIVKHLEEIVNKHFNGESFEKILVALKGLGNIGIMTNQFEKTLKNILVDENENDDLKVQVIETFRKTNCEKTRHFFMDIYQNFSQSVEVRIYSYLNFMNCPSVHEIKEVKNFLIYHERVNQVGSFVWSHLSNLMKTSSPQKVELQGLLLPQLDDKWKIDFRKYSRNYEYSLFFDEYNFGISGESNVLFGTESYLPGTVYFNGTVNLFGNSFNPLEFKIRIKGMEVSFD